MELFPNIERANSSPYEQAKIGGVSAGEEAGFQVEEDENSRVSSPQRNLCVTILVAHLFGKGLEQPPQTKYIGNKLQGYVKLLVPGSVF